MNSTIGVLLTEALPDAIRLTLTRVQHDLFDLGGELSVPGHTIISAEHIAHLKRELDTLNAELPALENFILPGGTRAAAAAHMARAVCRRAERTLVSLARTETVPPLLLQYLNRLSDFLFVAARALNRHAGATDVLWEQAKRRVP